VKFPPYFAVIKNFRDLHDFVLLINGRELCACLCVREFGATVAPSADINQYTSFATGPFGSLDAATQHALQEHLFIIIRTQFSLTLVNSIFPPASNQFSSYNMHVCAEEERKRAKSFFSFSEYFMHRVCVELLLLLAASYRHEAMLERISTAHTANAICTTLK
jgi:hypothetical protein